MPFPTYWKWFWKRLLCPRPLGPAPDLGADELLPPPDFKIYLPALRQPAPIEQATFDIFQTSGID